MSRELPQPHMACFVFGRERSIDECIDRLSALVQIMRRQSPSIVVRS